MAERTTAWLIERTDAHMCVWDRSPMHRVCWVTFNDPHATRYPTKEAAEAAIDGLLLSGVRVVEHSWVRPECTCHHTCSADSHSGRWHQHEDEPCPVHPAAPMVG